MKNVKYSELDLNKVEKLSGEEMKVRFKKIFKILNNVDRPLFFTGLPGSGKTVLAKALAKYYSKKNGVKAYYVQLSPDMTKTSIILGLRLLKGDLVPYKGLVAHVMEEGGVLIIDEATHTTQQLLLMFNSVLDRESITSIGDDIIYKNEKARFMFCSNDSSCAGNIAIPQSFAQRSLFFDFKYPSFEDEKNITKSMLKTDIGKFNVPDGVINYVINIVREVRNKEFPLSVRNIVNSLLLLELEEKEDFDDKEIEIKITKILGDSAEAKIKNIYKNIYGKEENDISKISVDQQTNDLLSYVASIGHDNFRENILNGCLFYADIDGFSDINKIKDKLFASIL